MGSGLMASLEVSWFHMLDYQDRKESTTISMGLGQSLGIAFIPDFL